MSTVVFVHGWGYDAHLWDEVRALLDPTLGIVTLDFGYFGAASPAPTLDEPVLAVGHSLGVLWWLAQSAIPWRRLLSINGFPRFTASADYPGVAPRLLCRMQQQFRKAPATVLADFHARCGGHAPFGLPNLARLAAGLDALGEWDGRARLASRRSDVVALAGTNDPIVPAAMSRMAFGTVEFIDTTGHLLPETHPEICARWIERLADA
ncbi:alpha/beta fold hydrolase [Sulfuricystis multivorans]|uniref:alpha/beta fold hydrolase n=1 Tax=Sulfuricystis multivorans TaxID=2211108 RepID=UPI000F84A0F5|nr:alpha/beta fold hydrolase [Sulfuricystis multivorans]